MNVPLDMTKFIEARSDQLNADDLIGGPRTITITRVSANDGDQPVNVYFQGDNGKPFRPCKTIRRVMVAMWGADASQYAGRSMTIYRDPSVQFGGMQVGGIRISHMSHIDGARDVVVMKSKGKKAAMKILPLAQSRAPAAPAVDPSDSTGSQHHAADPGPAVGEVDPEWAAWVEGAIGVILKKPDLASLARWQQAKSGEIATLESDHTRLHGQLMQAINDRRAAIEAADEGAL